MGSNIINALYPKCDFILLKRENSDLSRISKVLPHLTIHNICDVDENLIQQLDVDILLHCATHYGRKDTDPVNTIEANLLLPLRLLSLFKKENKQVSFINTDTILDKQINAYSLSKSQFREWMQFFSQKLVLLNIQLEHFYGPGDDKSKFVSYLIDAFLKNIPFLDLTKGEQNRYFTYIDDIVSAFEIIINKIEQFSCGYNEFQISCDEPVNLKDFVLMVKKISGNNTTTLNFGAVPYRKGELMNFCVNSKSIRELGWRPSIELEEGLKKTIELDKANR